MKLFARFQSTAVNVMAIQLQSLRNMRDYVVNRRISNLKEKNEEENEGLLVEIIKQLDDLMKEYEEGIKRTVNSDSKIRGAMNNLGSSFLTFAIGSGLMCIMIQYKIGFQSWHAVFIAFLIYVFLISPYVWTCYDSINLQLTLIEGDVRSLERLHDNIDEISGDFEDFNVELSAMKARELVFDADCYKRNWGFMVVFGFLVSFVFICGMSFFFCQWHGLV